MNSNEYYLGVAPPACTQNPPGRCRTFHSNIPRARLLRFPLQSLTQPCPPLTCFQAQSHFQTSLSYAHQKIKSRLTTYQRDGSIKNCKSNLKLGHCLHQVYQLVGVAPLVVIPRHHFHKAVVQRNTCLRIKDRSALISQKILRHHFVFRVS